MERNKEEQGKRYPTYTMDWRTQAGWDCAKPLKRVHPPLYWRCFNRAIRSDHLSIEQGFVTFAVLKSDFEDRGMVSLYLTCIGQLEGQQELGKGQQELGNYRPINHQNANPKACEYVIKEKLYPFVIGKLTNKQSGFRKNDSTTFQMARITHEWHKALDAGKYVGAVFLDLSKAFDKIWHAGLLLKLQRMGVDGLFLQWLESYLSNRQQRVIVNGETSAWQSPLAGVQQGSILGPLLFDIYTSDIVASIDEKRRIRHKQHKPDHNQLLRYKPLR